MAYIRMSVAITRDTWGVFATVGWVTGETGSACTGVGIDVIVSFAVLDPIRLGSRSSQFS